MTDQLQMIMTANNEKHSLTEAMGGPTTTKWWSGLHSSYGSYTEQELKKDAGNSCHISGVQIVYECAVCLCEVEPQEEDGSKKLRGCKHGVEFHCECIESWLKDHSTCPLCRTHVPQGLCHRLRAYLFKVQGDIVTFCNLALENVATSIGDCHS